MFDCQDFGNLCSRTGGFTQTHEINDAVGVGWKENLGSEGGQ
jgi:hypothetical protein